MWGYLQLCFFQLLIGLAIGFYFTDKRAGLSFKEIKIGTIAFLLFSAIILFRTPELTLSVWIGMLVSCIVLFGSILFGEWLHLRLLGIIIQDIRKDTIQTVVVEFVEQARQVACNNQDYNKKKLDTELTKVITYLKRVSYRASLIKQTELQQTVNHLSEACVALARLSSQIKSRDDVAFHRYLELSDQLLAVCWETLDKAEHNIEHELKGSFHTITVAVKSAQMK